MHVHGRYEMLKGAHPGLGIPKEEVAELYDRAKRGNDAEAAADLVERIYDEDVENAIIDALMEGGRAPMFLTPRPAFSDPDQADAGSRDGPTNALPFALAARLQAAIGGELDGEIIQAARIGRSKLNNFQRFVWQPRFTGCVRTDRPYVLVDDVFTLGGTFAALRNHIVENGGTVAAVTALARKTGGSAPLALTTATLSRLKTTFGVDFERFWKEAIGHEILCLSDAEGAFLVEWAHQRRLGSGDERLLALRDRLAEVGSKGE